MIPPGFQIVEGIAGMWHYHLARDDAPATTSLCGKKTMLTHCRLASWGFKPRHLPTSYCAECERIATGGEENAE